MTGRSIGHYEIIAKIGEGGMGAVYKARDTRLNRIVAIKTLSGTTPERKARFLQEAQAASALNHPNIVTVHDLLRDGGQDYIVMEFVPGKTLDHAIPSHGFRFDEALKIAIQIAAALTRAHEAGIVHRDVKPSNIIVRDDGTVKVLDFGLAKLTEPILASGDDATRTARPATEEGTIIGTVSYMSPEQAEGRPVDPRSDIFSFGSVLFEMLTGRRAFHGSSKLSTLSSILKEDPKPPSQTGANVPRDLERVLFRCLRKDAERRYQLMKEVRLALEELKEESDSGHLTGAAAPARPRSRMAVYLSLAATVLAFAGAALWYRSQSAPKPPSELSLRQLTQDAGYTGDPSISPDGKLVAYASDRAGGINLDIWVQQIAAGSQPIQLTKDPADDLAPSFSPDGGQIAFRSRREGGGVFLIPALGGEERVVLRGLYLSVAFSPDGQSIAASRDPFATRLFVVPAAGGTPTQIAPDFYSALVAAWSPDGKKLLFLGAKKQGDRPDLWLADVRGGSTIRLDTGASFAGRVSGQLPGSASWKGVPTTTICPPGTIMFEIAV